MCSRNNFMRLLLFIVFTVHAMIFNSCSLVNPDSSIPAYIHIDSISLETDYATQGSSLARITDVWVIYDNQYLGTFPLPADVPLPDQGMHSLSLKGGVIENGIAALRSAYPKYDAFDTVINLVPLGRTAINPKVTYIPQSFFPQVEDFDDASITLSSTSSGTVPLTITGVGDPNAFEGNSGVASLDDNHSLLEVASSVPLTLPINVPSYIELNYKGDIDFTVGVFASTVSGILRSELLTLRSADSWKKVYISISDLGGIQPAASEYTVFIHALKPASVANATLYFDNLKVVY